ncbi:MAG: OB-fold domain-containing protein [Alphaproteobacteria bacterium]
MTFPAPEITEVSRPYWEGLAGGVLKFQHCGSCGERWLPARSACPACLAPDPAWLTASGAGQVVSWVVYHHAYADHLQDKVPYDVTIVELDEGPRLLTNIVNSRAGADLHVGSRVNLAIETEEGVALARFRLLKEGDES